MADHWIKQLIAEGESETVEFKTLPAHSTMENVGRIVCSFLNSRGGTLLLGVSDNGALVGVEQAAQRAGELQEYLLQAISPAAAWSVNCEAVDGREIIVIDVPKGVALPYVCGNAIFVRAGASAVAATGPAISQLISQRQEIGSRWERLPALGLEIEDLDTDEIRRTAQDASQRRLANFDNLDDVDQLLESLGLASNGILNSAVVLYGKNPARQYPQIRVKAARFQGNDVLSPLVDNRSFEGHAFSLVEQIEAFLRLHIPITTQPPTTSFQRLDKPIYPWLALREGILNAIVHRDYAAFDGGLSVGLYDDRIEIWNAGKLPDGMTIADLKQPHPSLPHNPDIANAFYLRGYIERWGMGTRHIVARCVEAGLPEPEWHETPGGGVMLTIRLTRASILNPRQKQLLKSMKAGATITPKEYINFADNIAERTARTDLITLAETGYLIRRGQGRSTIYVRTDKKP